LTFFGFLVTASLPLTRAGFLCSSVLFISFCSSSSQLLQFTSSSILPVAFFQSSFPLQQRHEIDAAGLVRRDSSSKARWLGRLDRRRG
jgi:hypothetical protein